MRVLAALLASVFLVSMPLRAEKKPTIKLSFDVDRADYEVALLEARRDLKDAEASVRHQKDLYQRQEVLYRRRVLAEFEFKESEDAFAEARFKLTEAKHDLTEAEVQLRIAEIWARPGDPSRADKVALATGYVDLCRIRLDAAIFEVDRAESRRAYRAYRVQVMARLSGHQAESKVSLRKEEEKLDHAMNSLDSAREGVTLAKRQLAEAEKCLEDVKKG